MFEGNEAIYVSFEKHAVTHRPAQLAHNKVAVGLFPETLNCPLVWVKDGRASPCDGALTGLIPAALIRVEEDGQVKKSGKLHPLKHY